MNIVADESVDAQIVDRVRSDKHTVQSIAEFNPGMDDQAVLRVSRDANAVLLRADKDFGELVFRQGLLHSGVVLIRLAGILPERKADLVSQTFAQYSQELHRAFAVLSRTALRIRNLA